MPPAKQSGPAPHTTGSKLKRTSQAMDSQQHSRVSSASSQKRRGSKTSAHSEKPHPEEAAHPKLPSTNEQTQSANEHENRTPTPNGMETEDTETEGDEALTSSPTQDKEVPEDQEKIPRDVEVVDENELQQSLTSSRTGSPSQYTPIPPEEFDTKSFLSSISDLSTLLRSESMYSMDSEFNADEMSSVVSAVTISMENFRNYATHSQQHLEMLREQIHETKERMHKKIHMKPYDPSSGEQKMSVEERELQERIGQLNKELGRAAEELARAQQITSETEIAATETALLAEHARQDAKRIQEEYEARRAADEEARRKEEVRRLEEEKERLDWELKAEQARQREAARRSALVKDEQAEPEWHRWPTFTYRLDEVTFEHGIGCIVRGDANHFRENDIKCVKLPLLSEFGDIVLEHAPNEELVSNVVEIQGTFDEKHPIYLVMPHCMTRASAISREPVIKHYNSGSWVELKSEETHIDTYKELKFVHARISTTGRYVVVSRFKRDYLHFSKRGGKAVSSVDQRLMFHADRETFTKRENFVVQIQPVDSHTLAEVRKTSSEGKGLLTSSAVIITEWTSRQFGNPVQFFVPVAPNPVKARKHAAARAAREAKRKNPVQPVMPLDPEEERRKREEKKRESARQAMAAASATATNEDKQEVKKPTRWYMGQYGNNDDDEEDILYLVYCDSRGKWQVAEKQPVTAVKLDLVTFSLSNPCQYPKFMLLRTKTDVDAKQALTMANDINTTLSERICQFIIKQKSDDPYSVKVCVCPFSRSERHLQQMEEEGYEQGPGTTQEFVLHEGEPLGVTFRGNIMAVEEDEKKLDLVFASQLDQTIEFEITERNKFLQKSYNVYRGLVQLQRKTALVCLRRPMTRANTVEDSGTPRGGSLSTTPRPTTAPEMPFDYRLVAEHLISIPKDNDAPVTVINKAPVVLSSSTDVLNEDTLHRVAAALGDEWQKLGACLNVRRTRIQAILRNNAVNETGEDGAKYDMLISWIKSVPRSLNKVDILRRGLSYVGRDDLSEELHDLNEAFLRQRNGGQ